MSAREFAAGLINATDFGECLPHGVLMRECLDAGFEFEECPDCGRVENQHSPSCPSAPACQGCGVWPCRCDDHAEGLG
jgi:hypothetical protein